MTEFWEGVFKEKQEIGKLTVLADSFRLQKPTNAKPETVSCYFRTTQPC